MAESTGSDEEKEVLLAKLQEIVAQLPPVRFAMGYGSGVVKQRFSFGQPPMKDFILVVDNAPKWHAQNIHSQNRGHYSGLAALGAGFVSRVQKYGAGVYYNTHVEIIGENVKYGVIDLEDLKDDLLNWRSLYVAGRMQKPCRVVVHDPEIEEANEVNLHSALAASLLLLPAKFEEIELWRTITSLSYLGDFRMGLGENPHKVRNIVTKENLPAFEALYERSMKKYSHLMHSNTDGTVEQDVSEVGMLELIRQLPPTLKERVMTGLVHRHENKRIYSERLHHGLSTIVKTSSTKQAIKGIFTAGIIKSAVYAYEKYTKMKKGAQQHVEHK